MSKEYVRNNLGCSILGVLGLAHYTTADDIVILLPLWYIEFQKTKFIPVYLAKTIDNRSEIKLA